MAPQPFSPSRAKGDVRATLRATWTLRDWLAAALLCAGTAATVLWQNAHVAVLWDFSYVLESAVRIADGQMPYRDFPFVHAPLTFLIQAAILRLFGRVFIHHVVYAVLAGAAGTLLAWRIVLDTLRGRVAAAWSLSLLLAAPLTVVGIYCIVPLPSYDCDCGLAALVAVWMLRRVDVRSPDRPSLSESSPDVTGNGARPGTARGFAAGIAVCLPLFFKQNIGLPFLVAVAGVAAWVLLMRALRRGESNAPSRRMAPPAAVLAGAVAALLAAGLLIQFTAGLGNYLHWTIRFAAERRLPGASIMLGVYRDPNLLWTIPCVAVAIILVRSRARASRRAQVATQVRTQITAQIAALALFAAPFLFEFASLFLYDDADERGDGLLALWPLILLLAAALALVKLFQSATAGAGDTRAERIANLRALMPVVLLAAIHGAFLSQQLWGSTYGIWPLLILLLAEMIAFVAEAGAGLTETDQRGRWIAPALAALVSVTLLVCGGFYTASEERLSYAQFPDGPPARSAFLDLRGMATPGPYLPQFDELLRYAAANIPPADGILLMPGEDPFYFATGRVPQFPVLLFDPATDPYSPEEIAELARTRGIHWLIVKRDLQIKQDPTPQRAATLQLLMQEFVPAARLRGYDVYRR
jgi:hypothetical protein